MRVWSPQQDILTELIEDIRSHHPQCAIVLIGSVARGDERPGSDVDLNVFVPDSADAAGASPYIGDDNRWQLKVKRQLRGVRIDVAWETYEGLESRLLGDGPAKCWPFANSKVLHDPSGWAERCLSTARKWFDDHADAAEREAANHSASKQKQARARRKPPVLRVDGRGIIFDAERAPESEAVAYMTSLAPLASGAFLAGWQCGSAKHAPTNTIGLARSRDGGQTWEKLSHPFGFRFETSWRGTPGSLMAAEMVETQPGRLMLFTTWVDRSEPDRPLFNPETEGILSTRLLYCVSTDEGDTWGDWTELPTPALSGCAITGPIVRWSDGTIACAYESFKEFDDPTPVDPATWLSVSRDGGVSFEDPWQVARHPQQKLYYWDQRLCPSDADDEFIAMFWTHDRAAQRDLNVHLLRASLADGRKAAGRPVSTNIPGQIAACCVAGDGRILAYVVDRGRPGTLTLWQSVDGGLSWPDDAKLVVHIHDEQAAITQGRENIDYAEFWEDMGKWSFGHPAIRPLPTGYLVAWYAGTPSRMGIHWATIAEGS